MTPYADTNSALPHPIALWILKAMLLILGITALVSGLQMILDPTGESFGFPEGSLDGSPFSNYLIPGLLLTVCIGILPLVAWFALWKKPKSVILSRINPISAIHWAWAAALKSSIALMIWISVQMLIVPYSFLQPFLLSWGFIMFLLCFSPGVRAYYKVPDFSNKDAG